MFTALAGSGSITVTAPAGCSWAASTAATWLHLTGVISGAGNGVVPFTVDANSGAAQRSGYITVQRQSTSVVQAGTVLSILTVSPSYGSGATGQFTFQLRDANGYTDLGSMWVRFLGPVPCWLEVTKTRISLLDDTGSWAGPILFSVPGQTLSNSVCSVSSTGSSFSGSGTQMQITLQLNFFAAFGGAHRISAEAWTLTNTDTGSVPLGTWTVPAVQPPAVTIAANNVGAPFTLDNGPVYQAPATFYFAAGSQHTIQWLSSQPGVTSARYVFQNWTDLSTDNPRTITVPASDVTYTGNLTAQYLLTTAASPVGAGAITANPTSPDGFYNAGQVVTLTAVPGPGYVFFFYSGNLSGNTISQPITMSAARSVVATFGCLFSIKGSLPNQIGPGPVSGMIIWTAGAGCQSSASSNVPWLTLGTQTQANGFTVTPYSITENTGASRSGTVTFSGDYNSNMALTQDAPASARPNAVSLTPNSGNTVSQIFTVQAHDSGGYDKIGQLDLTITGADGLKCLVTVSPAGSGNLWLRSDTNTLLGPMSLPGTHLLENSQCQLSGPASSVSGSGKTLTVNLGISFKTAFAGPRYMAGQVYDSTNLLWGPYVPLGTWTVPAVAQSAVTIASNIANAAFTLDDGPAYQSPITFYFPVGSQHSILWLSALPGVTNQRYAFQNWSDLSTDNPRTLTIPASNTTYTGNLLTQYLLTTTAVSAAGGSVAASPASVDGFYNSGLTVTITATPVTGYRFAGYSGALSGGPASQALTMDGARSVTANFLCDFAFFGWLPTQVGPGPVAGMFLWTAGAGCQISASSNAAWLTLGPQTQLDGFNVIRYSIAENAGGSRGGTVTFTGDNPATAPVTQDAASSTRTNAVSVTPDNGNTASQVFALKAHHTSGYAQVGAVDLRVTGADSHYCELYATTAGAGSLWLTTDGTTLGPLSLPGTGILESAYCVLSAATSSLSGSGKTLTANLGLSFKSAFAGSRRITGIAYDTFGTAGPLVSSGTVSVSANPAVLSVVKTADSATVAAGSAIGFTVAAGNSSAPGTGVATAVTLNDPLPAGTGINWSVSPAYNGPGTCAITGAVGSQSLGCSFGTLVPGATASVHVSSATVPAGCKVYSNAATLTADNLAPLQSSSTSTVQCPALSVSGPASLPIGLVGGSYPATTITASGGTGIYTWTASGLPDGLSIAPATGLITGTPSTDTGSPFAVEVTVTDSNSVIAKANYNLTVSLFSLCDANRDTHTNVADVQLVINEALGVILAVHDLNKDTAVNVVDVQIEINAALGLGCSAR